MVGRVIAAPPPVLYEDNHLLVVEKPPNMPVQADSSGDADLLAILKAYIKEKYKKPGDVFLGLVHRLDRPVGGVMVFARTSKAAARLSAQFQGREAAKRYAAVVEGAPPAAGELTNYIRATEGAKRVEVLAAPTDGAKEARLRYRVLAAEDGKSLLYIELLTGRKHQIRAQLAAAGYPICCDQRYHPTPAKGQIALWACSLNITHPTKGERMAFTSQPQGPAFQAFPAAVEGLAAAEACTVLYRDTHVLAVSKRAGIEVTAADSGEQSLQAQLEECFGPLYPAHRLDANTEGVLLMARTAEAHTALMEALAAPGTEKLYHCIAVGAPPAGIHTYTAYGYKDADAARLAVYGAPRPGAQRMETGVQLLAQGGGLSLLAVRLHTGRTHQIRAHLAYLGWPVLGDDKYGNRAANKHCHVKRQQLLAKRLTLSVPEKDSLLAYLNGAIFEAMEELEWPPGETI